MACTGRHGIVGTFVGMVGINVGMLAAMAEALSGITGSISFLPLAAGNFRARARVRIVDDDGIERRIDVTATVPTDSDRAARSALGMALNRKLTDMEEAHSVRLRGIEDASRMDFLTEAAIAALASSGVVARSTIETYDGCYRRHLKGTELGSLSVDRAAHWPAAVQRHLDRLVDEVGLGTAQTCRAILSRTFAYAIRNDLVDASPMKSLDRLRAPKVRKSSAVDKSRALTHEEKVDLAWQVARSDLAKRHDLRDIVLLGFALAGRIGEVLALRHEDVLEVDGQTYVCITGTVRRVDGKVVRSPTKTEASNRSIPVAPRIGALLRRRRNALSLQESGPIFPTPGRWSRGTTWRDPNNTVKRIRELLDESGYPWATYHTIRRTAATTLIDVIGVRAASAMLGHTNSRTTLTYYAARDKLIDPEVVKHL